MERKGVELVEEVVVTAAGQPAPKRKRVRFAADAAEERGAASGESGDDADEEGRPLQRRTVLPTVGGSRHPGGGVGE